MKRRLTVVGDIIKYSPAGIWVAAICLPVDEPYERAVGRDHRCGIFGFSQPAGEEYVVKDIGLRFPRDEEEDISCRIQDRKGECDSFRRFDTRRSSHGRNPLVPLFDYGTSGEYRSGVSVIAEAEQDQVELGESIFLNPEIILKFLLVYLRRLDRCRRIDGDGVNVSIGDIDPVEKNRSDISEIAFRIAGRDESLVTPEEVNLLPVDAGRILSEYLVKAARSASSCEDDREWAGRSCGQFHNRRGRGNAHRFEVIEYANGAMHLYPPRLTDQARPSCRSSSAASSGPHVPAA